MLRNILLALVVLALALPAAQAKMLVQNSQGGFSFELPTGFQPIPPKAKGGPDVLESYWYLTPAGTPPVAVLVTRLHGPLKNPPVPVYFPTPKELTGTKVEYQQASWKSYHLPVARVTGTDGVPMVIFEVQLPLSPNAMLVMVAGPATFEKTSESAVRSILSTLQGTATWPAGAVGVARDDSQPAPATPATAPVAAPGAPIPAGRYAMAGKPEIYFDVRPDGTFTFVPFDPTAALSGKYTVKGAEVTFALPGKPSEVLQLADGALVGPDGSKWPRSGDAAPPPAAAGTAARTSPSASVDPLSRLKSINNVKQLCVSSALWASNHQGSFPDDVNQLFAKDYLGDNKELLHCPLLHDDQQAGYLYFGKGLKDTDPAQTILFMSRWQSADGQRIVGHLDGSVVVEVPKPENIPAAARASLAAAATPAPAPAPAPPRPVGVTGRYKLPSGARGAFDFRQDGTFTIYSPTQRPLSGTYSVEGTKVTLTSPGNAPVVVQIANGTLTSWDGSTWQRMSNPGPPPPNASVAANTPAPPATATTAAPGSLPPGATILLTVAHVAGNNPRITHVAATFPAAQMPQNPKNYVWIVTRPDNKVRTVGLNGNEHPLGKEPGVYKVYIEYRAGRETKVVSNVLEVTVPGA